jgi:hypothetical protein
MQWCMSTRDHLGHPLPRRTPAHALALAAISLCLFASACTIPTKHARTTPTNNSPTPTTTLTTNPKTSPNRTSTPVTASLHTDFAQLEQTAGGLIGLAIAPVGHGEAPTVLGDWTNGVAWSTSKVPLAIAALRSPQAAALAASVTRAITQSDNSAADALWQSLGDPATAARKVEAVLHEGGDDTTTVQSHVVRPGFSAIGQTMWSLDHQARFASALPCIPGSGPVLEEMQNISVGQQWGLGTIPGASFKGGWGPGPPNGYLVRQFGVIDTPDGQAAIAIATEPESGTLEAGTQILNRVAKLIQKHLTELPGGSC